MSNSDKAGFVMKVIANSCSSGTCPTVYETDRGTVMVQGYTVSAEAARTAGVDLPDGEQMVEIPLALLVEAARSTERS